MSETDIQDIAAVADDPALETESLKRELASLEIQARFMERADIAECLVLARLLISQDRPAG